MAEASRASFGSVSTPTAEPGETWKRQVQVETGFVH